MTERAVNKIVDGLKDAIAGKISRVTFVTIGTAQWCDADCPRCGVGHRWRRKPPRRCRHRLADGEKAREA